MICKYKPSKNLINIYNMLTLSFDVLNIHLKPSHTMSIHKKNTCFRLFDHIHNGSFPFYSFSSLTCCSKVHFVNTDHKVKYLKFISHSENYLFQKNFHKLYIYINLISIASKICISIQF